ncbi:activating transcription factor 7-interacting protein 2-like [Myzus persicae]|uniref:activating transcription factor 7-interacting protein 2-like n=1 Tax=Myzus persicae TaxID=13164 RepID=UPI000B9379DC|nr:activating transcription factor 7-interacting protein 2-like [Myzus persicae]
MSSSNTVKKITVTTSVTHKPCPKSKRKRDRNESGPSKILVHQGGLLRMAKAVMGVAVAVLDTAEESVLNNTAFIPIKVVYESGSGVSKNTSAYPPVPRHDSNSSWGKVPLAPVLTLSVVDDVVTLEWDERSTASMLPKYARVAGYELFGYRGETPSSEGWKRIRYFKAGRLPMKCKLLYRRRDVVHNYAVRAVDVHNRCAPCSVVKTLPSDSY